MYLDFLGNIILKDTEKQRNIIRCETISVSHINLLFREKLSWKWS